MAIAIVDDEAESGNALPLEPTRWIALWLWYHVLDFNRHSPVPEKKHSLTLSDAHTQTHTRTGTISDSGSLVLLKPLAFLMHIYLHLSTTDYMHANERN